MTEENQQLIPLSNVNAAVVFEGDGGDLDKLLKQVHKSAETLVADVNTEKGRKEIASVAYNVARSKTAIDEAGKEYVAQLKARTKIIDQRRRYAREDLDALRDKVRDPLNRWEENENARIQGHSDAITDIRTVGNTLLEQHTQYSVEELKENRARVEAVDPADFEEFEENCAEARLAALAKIDTAIARREEQVREQAELEQLRKERDERISRELREKAEREQKEREEQIRREAEERAQREAEEAQEQARQQLENEQNARKRAEEAAAEAEARAKQAAEDAKREEQERQQRAQAAADEERRKREANTRHKGACNSAAADAIMEHCKLGPTQARKVVEAIVKGKIPRVTLEY
jgi:colicin import membrane protein